MKRKNRHGNYPALFVPEQTENENYDSKEKSTHSCRRTINKYDLRIFAKAKNTRRA